VVAEDAAQGARLVDLDSAVGGEPEGVVDVGVVLARVAVRQPGRLGGVLSATANSMKPSPDSVSTEEAPAFQPAVPPVLVRSLPLAVTPTRLVQVTESSPALVPTSGGATSRHAEVKSRAQERSRARMKAS